MDKRKERINILNKQLEELKDVERPYVDEKNKLQKQIDTENNKPLMGKCFKFRNSYGSGEKWWLYIKVISCDDWGAKVIDIQKDKGGNTTCEIKTCSANSFKGSDSYTPISYKEFKKNFDKLMKELKQSV